MTNGPEPEVYRVKNWNKHYENNRSRILKKLEWLPIPNRLDNDGYIELVMHPSGPAHLGVWLTILQTASRCNPRGVLVRDNRVPHTVESLARISRMPADLISDAMGRLVAIGWLEIVGIQEALAPTGIVMPESGTTMPLTRQRKKEGKKE